MSQENFGTATDLQNYGLDESFLRQFAPDKMNRMMTAVTKECVGLLVAQGRFTAPILSWDEDVTLKWACIVVYELKSNAGMAPQQASVGDENIFLRAKAARDWFRDLGTGDASSPGIVGSSTVSGSLPDAVSDDPRGW